MWIIHHASRASLTGLEDLFAEPTGVADGHIVWEQPLWLTNLIASASGGLVPPLEQHTQPLPR